MQAANRLQKALKAGSSVSFGAWQMLPGTNHSRTIARCGYDWMAVDTEHGNIDGTASRAWERLIEDVELSPAMLIDHQTVACMRPLQRSPLVESVQS